VRVQHAARFFCNYFRPFFGGTTHTAVFGETHREYLPAR
jgi:hypothetical protein